MPAPLSQFTPPGAIHAAPDSESSQLPGDQPERDETGFRVRPLKMLGDQMDLLLKGSGDCRLGDWIRLSEKNENAGAAVFGIIIGLKAKGKTAARKTKTAPGEKMMLVRLRIVHGKPGLSLSRAECLAPEQLAEAIPAGSEKGHRPLALAFSTSAFQPDARRLGHLTLVQGGRFGEQLNVTAGLMAGLAQHQNIIAIDPTGRLGEENILTQWFSSDQITTLKLGRDVHFAECDGETDAFLWMESPFEALTLADLTDSPLTILDLSEADCAARETAYTLLAETLLQPAGLVTDPPLPVLLYPEQFCATITDWVRRAYALGLTPVLTTSPYCDAALPQQAANQFRIDADQQVWLQGELTRGLPVCLPLAVTAPPRPPVELTPSSPVLMSAPATHFAPELQAAALSPEADEALSMLFPAGRERGIVIDGATPPSPAPALPAEPEPTADAYDSILGRTDSPLPEPAHSLPVSEPQAVAETIPETATEPDAFDDLNFDLDLDIKLYGDADWYNPADPPTLSGVAADAPMPESMPMPQTQPELPTDTAESLHITPYPEEQLPEAVPGDQGVFDDIPTPDWDGFDDPVVYDGEPEPAAQATPPAPAAPPPVQPTIQPEPTQAEAPPPPIEPPSDENAPHAFAAGDHVKHDAYGIGVITKVIPMDGHEVLNITFESVGKRIMDPSIARLTKV
ncbi:MAG: hypothetical protein AB7P76_00550 [Candidatus Melainabacteria bacterium]